MKNEHEKITDEIATIAAFVDLLQQIADQAKALKRIDEAMHRRAELLGTTPAEHWPDVLETKKQEKNYDRY